MQGSDRKESKHMEVGSLLYQRYRIQEVLGRGGMGAVYRAVDDSLGVPVAVKENFYVEEEEYARQFRREATILANLRHPNLPRVTDHFVIEGQGQYLVMDFIEGEDLRQRVDRMGALPEKEVLLLGVAVADALNYLHTLSPPVVHRDVKPGNIKVDPHGNVFLVDFGLAKLMQAGQETTTGARGLTPGYSPPEQYGSARTDPRSDIYALGATLYAVLTGFPPEDGLARAMNQATLTPVRERIPGVSRRAARVIEKAISVQPEDRYRNAAEFQQALLEASDTVSRQVAAGDVTVAPPPDETIVSAGVTVRQVNLDVAAPTFQAPAYPTSYPAGQPISRPRPRRNTSWIFILLLVFGGMLALVAGGFFLFPLLFGEDDPAAVAGNETQATVTFTVAAPTDTPDAGGGEAVVVAEASNTPEPEAGPTATEEPSPTPAQTPVGGGFGKIAFASYAVGERPQIWTMNLDGSGLTQITEEASGACQPDWSPDGTQLVFISPCTKNLESYPGSSLFVINADGTGFSPLPSNPAGDYDPAWSPDGSLIAFTSLRDGRPQIYVMDVATREVRSLSQNRATDFQPSWFPDEPRLLFVTTRAGPTQIWYMDIDDNMNPDVVTRTEGTLGDRYRNFTPVISPDGNTIIFMQDAGSLPYLKATTWEDGSKDRGWYEDRVTDNLAPMQEPDFSPDGVWIVFGSNPGGDNHDIYMMTVGGTGLERLTTSEALDFDPAWGP
ncbi:MAG: protein kinase [Anaerolineales bacterium]|nr:protein kinase [Anaerolineales bacterium]